MKVWNYKDYDDYVDWQVKTNLAKESVVWVDETTIEKICRGLSEEPSNIICHGTRNGKEQQYFKKFFPNCYIIGTEISPSAKKYEMTIQHDFNIQKKEWIGKFDILYSNSFDHSFEPMKTMKVWSEQLSQGGFIFFEYGYDINDNRSRPEDPVELYINDILELFKKNGIQYQTEFETIAFKKRRNSKIIVGRKNLYED